MPTIARWADLPPNVRQHLLDRMDGWPGVAP